MNKYKYNIVDAITGQEEHKEIMSGEAAKILKINPKAVSVYAQNHNKIRGKYIIPLIQPVIKKVEKPTMQAKTRYIFNEDGKRVPLSLETERDWEKYRFMVNPEAKRREMPIC